MKIDTLICSGGGPSGIAYSGIFKALLEKKIINQNLDGIQEIITTSIGILFSFCVMLKLNYRIAHDICMKFDIGSMLNFNDITRNQMTSGLNIIWKGHNHWTGVSDHRREGVAIGF